MKKIKRTSDFILSILISGFACIYSCTTPSTIQEKPKSPNVILINVDDWGWMDYGKKNSQWFKTPNIDQLSSESLVFENAYAGAANCAPSRACLLSGMNTPRHGIYTVNSSERGNARTRKIIPIPNTMHLHDSVVLIPELFKQSGYVTASIGKWHVGEDPKSQGIDYNIGGGKNGSPGKDGYYPPYNISNITVDSSEQYLTDRLSSQAIDFIIQNQDTSFFLYLPFYAVHTPLQPKTELYENDYKGKEGFLSDDQRKYAAMVENLDKNIGRILKAIDSLSINEETLIILTSDNGGISAISPQKPARAGKGSYFQGGLRVPLMIKWSGVSTSGTTMVPTVNLDFFPTFTELLDIKVDQPMDGMSILDVITGGDGKELMDRSIYWHFPIYLQAYDGKLDQARDPLFRTRPGSVILQGDWSLHHYFEDDEILLFNLENDQEERRDLSDEFSQVSLKMYSELDSWRRSIKAPIPTAHNPSYDSVYSAKQLVR